MPTGRIVDCARIFALTAVAGATSVAIAAPPVDVGAATRGSTTVDRAVESRSRILDRSRVTGRTAADASASGGVRYDNGGMVAGSQASGGTSAAAGGSAAAATTASGTEAAGAVRSTARGAAETVLGGRARTSATFDLDRFSGSVNGHASQLGRGRLGVEMRNGAAGQARVESRGTRAGANVDRRSGLGLGLGLGDRRGRSVEGEASVGVDAEGTANVDVRRSRGVRPERVLSQADAHLAKRLAQIDRMRDRAVETGDELLLQQADKLEVLARAQFEQRTTGEASVGTAMKTYNAARRDGETAPAEPMEPAEQPAPVETTANVAAEVDADVSASAGTDGNVIQTGATVETSVESGVTVE